MPKRGYCLTEHCVFCGIARREEPASLVYEDGKVLAFLDMRPVNEGHTLVIPRKHYENIYEIPEDEVAYVFRIVKKMAVAIKEATKADGISVIQNNGRAARQVVFHFHVHVIPRYEEQDSPRTREVHGQRELDRIASRIREFMQ